MKSVSPHTFCLSPSTVSPSKGLVISGGWGRSDPGLVGLDWNSYLAFGPQIPALQVPSRVAGQPGDSGSCWGEQMLREVAGKLRERKQVGFYGRVKKKPHAHTHTKHKTEKPKKRISSLEKKSPRLNLNSCGSFFVVIPLQITGIIFLQNARRCQALIDCLAYRR